MINHDQTIQAITDIQEARESHVQWAAHLRNTNRHDCQGCVDHAAHIGEASYHDEWISKYDNVIAVLQGRKVNKVFYKGILRQDRGALTLAEDVRRGVYSDNPEFFLIY